jgi:hypothetical protein
MTTTFSGTTSDSFPNGATGCSQGWSIAEPLVMWSPPIPVRRAAFDSFAEFTCSSCVPAVLVGERAASSHRATFAQASHAVVGCNHSVQGRTAVGTGSSRRDQGVYGGPRGRRFGYHSRSGAFQTSFDHSNRSATRTVNSFRKRRPSLPVYHRCVSSGIHHHLEPTPYNAVVPIGTVRPTPPKRFHISLDLRIVRYRLYWT